MFILCKIIKKVQYSHECGLDKVKRRYSKSNFYRLRYLSFMIDSVLMYIGDLRPTFRQLSRSPRNPQLRPARELEGS